MDIETPAAAIDLEHPTPVSPSSLDTEPDDSPLAAHEAAFGNGPAAPASVEEPAAPIEQPSQRARKDQAKPSDVQDIATFTRRLREAEEAIPIERKDGESERVYQLRRRAEIAELAKTYKSQPPAPAPQPKAEPVSAAPIKAPAPVSDRFTFDSFEAWVAKHTDVAPADAWDAWEADKLDARDAWKDAKQQAQHATAQQQAAEKQAEQAIIQKANGYQTQLDAYVKTYPDRAASFQNVPQVPPLMLEAIWGIENAPDVVYTLLRAPGLFQEMHLLTDAKPITSQNVATATAWLRARLPAGTTGSAPVSRPVITPRPPNPVRTGPIASGDDLPGDESSLADHEKAFGRRRHR